MKTKKSASIAATALAVGISILFFGLSSCSTPGGVVSLPTGQAGTRADNRRSETAAPDRYAYLTTVRTGKTTRDYRSHTPAKADSIIAATLRPMMAGVETTLDKKPYLYVELYCEKKEVKRRKNGKIKLVKIKN